MAFTEISVSSAAALAMQGRSPLPILVRNLISDADQGGVTPAGVHGQAWIVNNWAAGVYVGTHAGAAFANNDLAEFDDNLGGYVRIQQNAATLIPTNTRCLVIAAGAAGSFAALANNIVTYDGAAWVAKAPADNDFVHVIGEEDAYKAELFTYNIDTTTWESSGKSNLSLATTHFVDRINGHPAPIGDGSIDRPYRTIAQALAVAVAGDKVYIGPGTYAETIALNIRVDLIEIEPGTVNLANAVVGGAVLTLGGAAGTSVIRLSSIVNTNNATVADVALAITNATPAAVVFDIRVRSLSGGLLGTALTFTGDATNAQPTVLRLDADVIVGSMTITTANVGDECYIAGRSHTATPATWGTVTGGAGTAGNVRFRLHSSAAGILNLGNNTAMGCNVHFETGSFIGGQLNLHNNAGAGIVTFYDDACADVIEAAIANQIYLSKTGRWLEINGLGISLNAIADTPLYTVPAGQTFLPLEVDSINQGAASGALLVYQYDGTGAASVVAAVGAGAMAFGVTAETVVRDLMAAAAVLSLNVTTASGAADFADVRVRGLLANV